MAYPGQPPAAKPQNYLVWAIVTTLLCCLPLGVVSIVFAAQVDSKWNAGDYAGATDASNKARTWAMASAIVGLVFIAVYVVIIVVAASGDGST
jgi:heme/copper-type cytochrome/quinol oxidase subunit 2